MDVNRQYLKASEVADILGTHVTHIYNLCANKTLPSIKVGQKSVRIPKAGLDAFLAQQERSTASPAEVLLAEAMNGSAGVGTADALLHQAEAFAERAGYTAHEFVDLWRSGRIPDTAETADLAIEALALRSALDRGGARESVPA